MMTMQEHIEEAERLAMVNLARRKYMNFGYYAAIMVWLRRTENRRGPSPFRRLVEEARKICDERGWRY